MIFTGTQLKGPFILNLERREDSRGFFARAFCQNEFRAHGLKPAIAQGNVAPSANEVTIDCSATPTCRSAARASRSAPAPSATSRPARSWTNMGTT